MTHEERDHVSDVVDKALRLRRQALDSAGELAEFIEDYMQNVYPDPAVLEYLLDKIRESAS